MRHNPLFCVVANRTGIYKDDIRVFSVIDKLTAGIPKGGFNNRRIELIHLTPKGLEEYFFHTKING